MSLPEILGLISVILLTIILVGIAYLVFRRHPKDDGFAGMDRLETDLSKQVGDLKDTFMKTMFESMRTFSSDVNKQLLETSTKTTGNMADFQVKVNQELASFQEKINTKLTGDFTGLTNSIDQRMNAINAKVEERLSQGFKDTKETFVQIAERVKVIDDAQKKIEELSGEMIGLQNILTNNQARGSFGEYQLNQLLFSVFGENDKLYQTQYTIKEQKGKKEAVRADAVIFLPKPNNLVAIDSKFPFSSYSKLFDNDELTKEDEDKLIQSFGHEVRKHITDIADKYIVPGVTAEYALMFVASDGILALLHSRLTNVIDYARSKAVTIVSPTTLIPLLSSYWAMVIDYEQSRYAAEIKKQLGLLSGEFQKFGSDWEKLNRGIDQISRQSRSVNDHVEKITSKFDKIQMVDLPEKPAIQDATDDENDNEAQKDAVPDELK
ncbi:MAG TPA: DNA recombination protein RmuC [Bacillota bacterium]|nr:DNA recombination protein RmuC [Bacillota bacterium]